MNKRKIVIILTAALCVVLIGFGSVKYFRYAKTKNESLTKMNSEIDAISSFIDSHTEDDPVILEYGDEFDFDEKIKTIQERHPNIDVKINGNVDTKTVGIYEMNIILSATDSYSQTVSKDIHTYYSIFDTHAPVIEFIDEQDVYVNSDFDVDSVIKNVSDPIDGDLEKSDILTKGTYIITTDFKNAIGDYTVTVEAMDKTGLTSKAEYSFSVIARVKTNTTKAVTTSSYDSNRIYLGNYTAVLYFGDNQAIADAVDSANYYPTDAGAIAIADHSYQGFYSAMVNNSTGYAFGKPIHKVSTHYGYLSEDGWDIMFNDGGSYSTVADGAICMYTCIDNNGGRIITFWDYD